MQTCFYGSAKDASGKCVQCPENCVSASTQGCCRGCMVAGI